MIDVVAVFGFAQLVFELGRAVLPEFAGDPFHQRAPLRSRRLRLFFLWRHVLEVQLLLHLVEEVEAGIELELVQDIEPDLALLRVLVVARVTVVVEKLISLLGHGKFCRVAGTVGGGCCADEQEPPAERLDGTGFRSSGVRHF